jgi:hypothetical protein
MKDMVMSCRDFKSGHKGNSIVLCVGVSGIRG